MVCLRTRQRIEIDQLQALYEGLRVCYPTRCNNLESVTMNQQLIDDVLNQILQDVKDFDLTPIEELIKNTPEEVLKAYLPEEVAP